MDDADQTGRVNFPTWENGLRSLGSVEWEDPEGRVSGSSAARDEQLWTFLAACGYAIAGNDGVRRLTEILAGTGLHQDNSMIWLEAMPLIEGESGRIHRRFPSFFCRCHTDRVTSH